MRDSFESTQPAEERFEETKEKPAIFDEVTAVLEARREAGVSDDSLMQYILHRVPELDKAELSELEETKIKAILFSLRDLSGETAEMIVRANMEDFVFDHYEQFAIKDIDAFISVCIDRGLAGKIADHLNLFPNLDHNAFVKKVLRWNVGVYTLAGKLHNFKNLDESVMQAFLALDTGLHSYYLGAVLKNASVFPSLNVQAFVDDVADHASWKKLVDIIDVLPALPAIDTDKIFERARALINGDFYENQRLTPVLVECLDHFKRSDERDTWLIEALFKGGEVLSLAAAVERFPEKLQWGIVERLFEADGAAYVFLNIGKLTDSTRSKIVDIAIDESNGHQYDVLKRIIESSFDQFSAEDQGRVGAFLLKQRNYQLLFGNIKAFAADKRDEYVNRAIQQSGNASAVLEWIQSYEGLSRDTCKSMLPTALNHFFSEAVLMNNLFIPPLEESLTTFVGVLGDQATVDVYEWFIDNGKDVEKLKRKQELVTKALFRSDQEALNELERDQRFFDLAKAPLRYESSVHGNHSHEQFRKSITRYFYERAEYEPLPREYVPGTLTLFKKGKDNLEYTYSPEFQARWKTLLYSLQHAQLISDQPPGSKSVLPPLYARFTTILQDQRTELETQLERAPNEHAKRSVEEQIQMIDSIDLNTVEGMSDAFRKLYHRKKQPELAELFRTLGLYVAFQDQRTRGQIQPTFISMSPVTPSDRDISQVLDFVHHTTHQETWQELEAFQEPAVADALASLFHTGALEQELKRMQAGVAKGTETQIEVIPSRDLLTEFSGHIGDACWASRFNILKDYPHISSLTFMQNDKVAGSCLLIDTLTDEAEKITIIRGLNPLESVINKLDCASFVNALAAYLGPIAEKRGRKLAIVIDGHSGGSGTNRPMLFAYLSGLKQSLSQVPGVDLSHTRFNGYDITRDTYYLPTKE